MLDIKLIRENTEVVKEAARKKHVDVNIDMLLELDTKRIALQQELDEMRNRQNLASKDIPNIEDKETRDTAIAQMKQLKDEMHKKEEEERVIKQQWQDLMYQVPNIPDLSVPEGKEDTDNVELRVVGDIPKFDFEIKDHVELMQNLDMVDFERGTKVHGFRGYFLKGDGASLSFALWAYARDFFTKRGFVFMMPPAIAREENFYGTGFLPHEAEDIFKTQDDDYLIGTAEVPMMGYYAGETLEADQLPLKVIAFSPCYRREAGSHGKHAKGLYRVHEFYKMEQVILCEASHQTSVELHEEITKNSEEFLQSLGVPYHVVVNCGGDLGLGQVKKYDLESWVPSDNEYRETHSSSYFHDFQTRRFNIKYKDKEGKTKFCHSLNNTATATPRFLISLIENNQNADGSITIPEVLRPYMGKNKIQ